MSRLLLHYTEEKIKVHSIIIALQKVKEDRSIHQLKFKWLQAFRTKGFQLSLIITLIYFGGLVVFMNHFFSYIENREGILLNDWILNQLEPVDLSTYIFGVIYSVLLVGLLYFFNTPFLLLRVLQTIVIIYSLRIITLYFIKLDPPKGIIPLSDPFVQKIAYNGIVITKDLFFSGHAAILLILFLAASNTWVKLLFLVSLLFVSIMLLWQHVHYTVDVLGAIIFTLWAWTISKRLSNLHQQN
ncbi:sphingomyelin synthase family protein [Solitalea lacus]|uniref:sphingomyelin synthase family protein n=1 Tax=Solitalea lacus TaxID=2911172 RepID=UPI001EDA140C|nr:sphingomyelin synthase family protein [Solitalea lacus]UKJ09208.1 sphingomyelin synthase family protein [Solitalea lacus]